MSAGNRKPPLPPGFFGVMRVGDTVWTRREVVSRRKGRPMTHWETDKAPARDDLRSEYANWMDDPRLPGVALEAFRRAVQQAKHEAESPTERPSE